MILVTGATGMFGSRIVRELAGRGAPVRALVHSAAHAQETPGEVVVGDMDDAATLAEPLAGVETVFLVSPMDDSIQTREGNVLNAALEAGVRRIVKLHGAVRHRGDALAQLHGASIDAIRASGLEWALVSPSSVMETSLLSQAEGIRQMGAIFGCSAQGRIGLVAADDVARAAAVVLAEGGEQGRDYQLTGPAALTMAEVAAQLGEGVGREIAYQDMPPDDFRSMLVEQAGMDPETVDVDVMLHLLAWRRGDADLRTDTVRELTGREPLSVAEWAAAHREDFGG